ncbi:MAG: DUF4184 family protein [Betaproteobacteria bacterium]
MPYPIAHAAAAIALHRVFGRHSVPSALALGTVVPDLWYVLPWFERSHSHTGLGILEFCLPLGLAAYLLFHAVKLPLLELLPRPAAERLRFYACAGLPAAAWWAVCACLLAGAASHLAWDALTRGEEYGRIVRHASTLLGGAFVLWWLLHKLRAATPVPLNARLSAAARRGVLVTIAALALAAAAYAAAVFPAARLDYETLRGLARSAGIEGIAVLAWSAIGYGLLWHAVRRTTNRNG